MSNYKKTHKYLFPLSSCFYHQSHPLPSPLLPSQPHPTPIRWKKQSLLRDSNYEERSKAEVSDEANDIRKNSCTSCADPFKQIELLVSVSVAILAAATNHLHLEKNLNILIHRVVCNRAPSVREICHR